MRCRRCGTVIAYGDARGSIRAVEVWINGELVDDDGSLLFKPEWAWDVLNHRWATIQQRRGAMLPRDDSNVIVCYGCGKKNRYHSVKVSN